GGDGAAGEADGLGDCTCRIERGNHPDRIFDRAQIDRSGGTSAIAGRAGRKQERCAGGKDGQACGEQSVVHAGCLRWKGCCATLAVAMGGGWVWTRLPQSAIAARSM